MLRALKNFSCNGVKKREGQIIDSIELQEIKEFVNKLILDGLLEEKRDEKPIIMPKPRKKRATKKKV